MQASGLEGPIPLSISLLDKLTELRISDMTGKSQGFPLLNNMTGIINLVLRNCNISGEIPAYIWKMKELEMLFLCCTHGHVSDIVVKDVSFNKLVGEVPSDLSLAKALNYIYLSGNLLSGNIPDLFLKKGSSIDLSYNNFSWQGPEQPACQENMNLNVNLYRSSSMENNLRAVLPCSKNDNCPQYACSFHVNCGGDDLTIKESKRKVFYEGDAEVEGGTAKYFRSKNSYWGLSSTGDFMDDNNDQNMRYIETLSSGNISGVYTTARLSPLSLTYFGYCLENGDYTLQLHFAEIYFTNDKTYDSLGKRLFDIYIQEQLVHKDFNIEDEARGARKPVMKQFNTSVTNNVLEIRFYWAGKGTTRIPSRGVYGPLISAISVHPKLTMCFQDKVGHRSYHTDQGSRCIRTSYEDFKSCSSSGKKGMTAYIIGGVVGLCIILLILGFLQWKGCLRGRKREEKDPEGLDLQTSSFTLKQIKNATNNFDSANKIGEGGFGPVFKGLLSDGTTVAVKQLSSGSRQGDQLLLVYEYMENNSLARALFGPENSQLILDWPTRLKICIGIAKGLAFLHEESRLKIVHRDIKATNVLLDRDLNPKISDFGLARLDDGGKSHISTRIAGTIGYMAPEYALRGYLTYKADVYSFGIVVLEIACHLQQSGKLLELVDEALGPTMSEVVSMLEGRKPTPDIILEPNSHNEDVRFKAIRDFRQEKRNQSLTGIQTQNSTALQSFTIPLHLALISVKSTLLQNPVKTAGFTDLPNHLNVRTEVLASYSTPHLERDGHSVHIPLLILLLHTCFGSTSVEALAGHLPDEEKGVLKEIAEQLGKKDWKFELNPCDGTPTGTH
ncbi:putative LRR receptor-like serine/threonine-protein kinase RFK1 [Vitis vinifera]|uniref:non-specific serine/threonine protein kinase n=1 Tax=Vitis vinifera TaxID=29760 RepID=A0A438CP47_VITVI|nr:putative LRR receptor-like serine/threonine-protein kinase RFK1 [Vitis vinifera]